MSEPLFEQYRAALRRGHVSALAGKLDAALEAYREAARLAPERTLPLASQGTVLHRLDRWPEAAEVFDAALRLTPDDEATLHARATARAERGMDSGAAADFERLAFVLDVGGRAPEASEAARRANELESTASRVALAERLAEQAPSRSGRATASTGEDADRGPDLDLASDVATASDEAPMAAPMVRRIVAETDAEAARAAQEVDPSTSWPRMDLPSPAHELLGPAPDPEQLMNEAAELAEAGDSAAAGEKMLTAAAVHRAAGRLDAALDVCFQLLAIAPGDPHVHLAIANLQLDRGWTPLAREKIDLLVRLTSLTGDTQAEADVHGLAAERLRDEPVPAAGRR